MNEKFDDILDDLRAYALTMTDVRLDDIEEDINRAKQGEGTKGRKEFEDARDNLEKGRKAFRKYKKTTHPKLLTKTKGLVAYFEKLRDTGEDKSQAMAKLAELEALVDDVSPMDDEVTKAMRKASRISIRSTTLDHFGVSGSTQRVKFEDEAIDVNLQVRDLRTQRILMITQAFIILQADINQGIQALKRTTKRLSEIVKALRTLNTLLGIANRVVGFL